MAVQTVFKRYELKYLLTQEQKKRILTAMEPYMALDPYGRTTIRSLYYDTDNFRLARHSISQPDYKEKLRVRAYTRADGNTPVFVELKKKHCKVVYKRRVVLPEAQAMAWLAGSPRPKDNQISREIDYFRRFYGNLTPKAFLSYEREAYFQKDGGDFRVTFDENVLFRPDRLSLRTEPGGLPLLPPGRILMELKCSGAIPLWMVRVLSEEKIYKISCSKYGTAYRTYLSQNIKKETTYA